MKPSYVIVVLMLLCLSYLSADVDITLDASNGLTNRIELNWQLDNFGDVVFQDNFDTYFNGDLDFGDWLTIDGDGAPTIEFIDQNYHFPHANEAYAWTIADWQNSNVNSHSEPNTVGALANLNGVPNDDWLISPQIDFTSQTGFVDGAVSFWVNPIGLGLSIDPEHIKVLVSTTGTNTEDFTQIAEFFLEDKDVWKNITLPLTDFMGENIRIAINYCSVGNICVVIDDFKVMGYHDILSGFKLYRSNQSGGNYQLITQTTNRDYIDFDVIPNQTYYYVVSALLNGDQESNYSNEVSASASGFVITDFPYSVNFDNITPPNLPNGFLLENANSDTQTWETHDGGAYSNPNCIKYTYDSDNAADDWFFTPPLMLIADTQYRLTFQYRGNTTAYTEKLEVKMGHYASSQNMDLQLFDDDHIVTNEYSQAEIFFSPSQNGSYVLGWHAYSAPDQAALYVDDIDIQMQTFSDNDNISTSQTHLIGNYPNPFNPTTSISFDIRDENAKNLEIVIYNLKGEKVRQLDLSSAKSGVNHVVWNGKNDGGKKVASGVYLYRLNVNGKSQDMRKCVLMK